MIIIMITIIISFITIITTSITNSAKLLILLLVHYYFDQYEFTGFPIKHDSLLIVLNVFFHNLFRGLIPKSIIKNIKRHSYSSKI